MRESQEQTTTVEVSLGATINLGDFNNVKIEVRVQDYVRAEDGGDIGLAIDRVYEIVDGRVTKQAEVYK